MEVNKAVATLIVVLSLQCFRTSEGSLRFPLYPSPRNLHFGRSTATASSTCSSGASFKGEPCDGKFDPSKAIDTSRRTSWVSQRFSPTRTNITFTVDLNQFYHLVELTLLTGATSHAMFFDVLISEDGASFKPLVYFVHRRSACPPGTHYVRDIDGSSGIIPKGRPICSDEPRHLLEEQQLMANTAYRIPLLAPYVGGNDPAKHPDLMGFLKGRFLRFVFHFRDDVSELKVAPTSIISIARIRLSAICSCNGYATECKVDPATMENVCSCLGNTCGSDCSSCCPEFSSSKFESYDSGSGKPCIECDCNGLASSCDYDPLTGTSVCVDCRNGTAGAHCVDCADGFYRTSPDDMCAECQCVVENAANGSCDGSGQCFCSEGFSGGKCDQCKDGKVFNSFSRSCEDCYCNPVGSLGCHGDGDCDCARGYTSTLCDMCAPGYYGYPSCQDCGCPSLPTSPLNGSISCDPVSGQCDCPAHRTGNKCQSCDPGYHGNNELEPCQACDCHGNGSLLPTCDEETGKCTCKLGYRGLQCKDNSDEYFGFPDALPCNCDVRGSVDSVCSGGTGRCQCRPGAVGRQCSQCQDGTYPSLQGGCAACECSAVGAVSLNCTINGRCVCKDGVGGQDCETCLPGYWDFGQNGCTSCNCVQSGTDPREICDALSGDCVCIAEHAGEECGDCNTTRLHISTDEGCEICGDCVDPLANTTNTIINLLNTTIELLPNLTVRIGPFDLVYIERNASLFATFLDIWSKDVHSIEAALGLRPDPPPIPGSFVLNLVPPLLSKHSVLRDVVNQSTQFTSLDVFGKRVEEKTGRTFAFSLELDRSYAELKLNVEVLRRFLQDLAERLEDNFELVRSKRIRADEVNNIVMNRNFQPVAEIVAENLDLANLFFSESLSFQSDAQRVFDWSYAEVLRFNSSDFENQLSAVNKWLLQARDWTVRADSETQTAVELRNEIESLLPEASELSSDLSDSLDSVDRSVEANENILRDSQMTFEDADSNHTDASQWFHQLNTSTGRYEEELLAVVPNPSADLVAEVHANGLYRNGTTINSTSFLLRNEAKAFLASLPPIPDVEFVVIKDTLHRAINQALTASLVVQEANLEELYQEVDVANVTSYNLLDDAHRYEENSTAVMSQVLTVTQRFRAAHNWSTALQSRRNTAEVGLEELEGKPDFTSNFEDIRITAERSNATFVSIDSTLESIETRSPRVQFDIDTSRNNTEVIHDNLNVSHFLVGCVHTQGDETRDRMDSVSASIDSLMETNIDISREIDEIINGLQSVHNVIEKVNAPAVFAPSVADPRPFLSLQPPDRAQSLTSVLFELIDLYLFPNGLSNVGTLLFYAGPAWEKGDPNRARESKEETFIALIASRNSLTLHYKLKRCNATAEPTCTAEEHRLNHDRGQLLDLAPNHVQIMRVGNRVRLVRRSGGETGASKAFMSTELEGELLFVPSQRTVYYVGGQPPGVNIHPNVDDFDSFSGNINLLLYNHKEWSIWNIRDSSPTKFWDYSNSRKRGNTLVFTDLAESELLSFDGNGYLYTKQLAGGEENKRIKGEGFGSDSALAFTFSAQSRDGLIVFMFAPSQKLSLELSLVNGVLMLQVKEMKMASVQTLYFVLHKEKFRVAIRHFDVPGFGSFLSIQGTDQETPITMFLSDFFRFTEESQVWFGGFDQEIADTLRRRNQEEMLYKPNVTSSFRGSIQVGLQEPFQSAVLDIFTTSHQTFLRDYINSEFQRGVSRTAIKAQYVDLIGFTGESYLSYDNILLTGLIDIRQYRPSREIDTYALLFKTNHLESGVLFDARNGDSGIILYLDSGVVKVTLTMGSSDPLTLTTGSAVVGTNQWHSVLIHVTFAGNSIFKLFVDNQKFDEKMGLAGWQIHESEVSFEIPHLSVGGSNRGGMETFTGCIKDFIIQENPFNALAETFEPAVGLDFADISSRVGDRAVLFFECPIIQPLNPVISYPILFPLVEVYCVPEFDVEKAEFSLGGFRRDTHLSSSNTVPLLGRHFLLSFDVIFHNVDGIQELRDLGVATDHQHIFSLFSKYNETVSLVVNDGRNIVMGVKSDEATVLEVLLVANVSENVTIELSCSGSNDIFVCSLNGLPSVTVARRDFFYPQWPIMFGKVAADENSFGVSMDSFVGCIGNFVVSGVSYDNINTGQPCFDDAIPAYYFDGTTFIGVLDFNEEIVFSFKTVRTNGLLVTILENINTTLFKVKVAVGYRSGKLSASNRTATDSLEGTSPITSGCGLPSNLTLTPYEDDVVGIVYCEGPFCHSEVMLEVDLGTNDQVYIGGVPRDAEYTEQDVFQFLKPSAVSSRILPPFFVGTLYSPVPRGVVNNLSVGTAP